MVALVAGVPAIGSLVALQVVAPRADLASYTVTQAVVPTDQKISYNAQVSGPRTNVDNQSRGIESRVAKSMAQDASVEAARFDDSAVSIPCDADDLIVAILQANANGGGNLKLTEKCTYLLTANQDGNGLPTIAVPLSIAGSNATIVRAADADDFRLFDIGLGGQLTLHDVTLTGGLDSTRLGGGAFLVQPGGIATLTDVTFTKNESTTDGGAVENHGNLTLKHSTFSRNAALTDAGGAIASNGVLRIEESRFDHNSAADEGGAIYSDNVLAITDSTVVDNSASFGGAVFARGLITFSHTTIEDNRASVNGGGLLLDSNGTTAIRNSIIKANTAHGLGGGIYSFSVTLIEDSKITENNATVAGGGIRNGNSLTLRRTEVSDNTAFATIAKAGGISATVGTVRLENSRITGNTAVQRPGGVDANASFTVDPDSVIIGNRATNCVGSTTPVVGCFG